MVGTDSRSAGLAATYNRLDGWASKFLEAGAAAFIGSLWAVSEGASREFAEELYRRLKHGLTLGDASSSSGSSAWMKSDAKKSAADRARAAGYRLTRASPGARS